MEPKDPPSRRFQRSLLVETDAEHPADEDRYGTGYLPAHEDCRNPDLDSLGLGLPEGQTYRYEVAAHLGVVGEERRKRELGWYVAPAYLGPYEDPYDLGYDRPRPQDRREERQPDDERKREKTYQAASERGQNAGDKVAQPRVVDDADEHSDERYERQHVPYDLVYGLAAALEQDPDDAAHDAPDPGDKAGDTPSAKRRRLFGALPGERAFRCGLLRNRSFLCRSLLSAFSLVGQAYVVRAHPGDVDVLLDELGQRPRLTHGRQVDCWDAL